MIVFLWVLAVVCAACSAFVLDDVGFDDHARREGVCTPDEARRTRCMLGTVFGVVAVVLALAAEWLA